MTQIYHINNLTGGINANAEDNALDFLGKVAAEARDIENFVPLNRGGQQKTKGFQYFQRLGTTPIKGVYRFNRSNGSSVLLGASNNTIYRFSATTLDDLLMTLGATNPVHFETALDECLISDGVNTVRVFDGVNTTSLNSGTPNIVLGTKQTLFYQNRLWLYGNPNNPSLLYYSNPNDVTTGYDTQFINCDINDGEKITALTQFFIPGMLSPVIIVCKEKSIGLVTGDGSGNDPYVFSKINQDFGVAHFNQVISYSQSIVFFTQQGVFLCQSDLQNLNLHFRKLSSPIQNLLNELPADKLKNCLAFHDWKRERLSFCVVEADNTTNNLIYHFDTRLSCWYKERWNTGQTSTCHFIDEDGTWYHGDPLGKLFIHNQVDHFDNLPITAIYKTPYIDFGRPHIQKQLMEMQLTLRGNGLYPLSIQYNFDYGSRMGKSTQLRLASGQYKWNAGVWTNNSNQYQWGSTAIKLKRFYPSGLFRQVQFILTQSGIDNPIDWFGLTLITT